MKNRSLHRFVWCTCMLVALLGSLSAGTRPVNAGTNYNQQVINDLSTYDVYISDLFYKHGKAAPSDLNRLQGAVYDAAKHQGVTEKIALVWNYPPNISSSAQGAAGIRNFLDLQGILILVSPRGVGLSSAGDLTSAEETRIARRVLPRCTISYVGCAVYAAQLAAVQAKSDKDSAYRSAAIFWIIFLVVFGLVVLGIVLFMRRRRQAAVQGLEEMRGAADQTLSLADQAVTDIEAASPTMAADVRHDYDRALGLRNRARSELTGASTPPALRQANEDAAQAVLALQAVMSALKVKSPLGGALDVPARKCFYCGHEDRAPYITRTIDDGKGHSMDVEICALCAAQLQQGRTPQIATAPYGGLAVPWWAVPGSPWYYGYGGPAWQYWLPFAIGMDVGGWFDGGWMGNAGVYDPGWTGIGGVYAAPSTMPPGSGGADVGSWGSPDSSGAGGADWGSAGGWGDGGGADIGGSGGSDSGAGGW